MSIEEYRKHFGIKEPSRQPLELKPITVKKSGKKSVYDHLPDGPIPHNGQDKKYRSTKVKIDGFVFHSTKEGDYYRGAKYRIECGLLKSFERQVKYKFEVNGILITSLTVDFVETMPDDTVRVIDVKSFATKMKKDYIIKKKMMKAFYGIEVIEV